MLGLFESQPPSDEGDWLCRDGGRENAVMKPFSDYPSVTYGDSSPDKGSQNRLFDRLINISCDKAF